MAEEKTMQQIAAETENADNPDNVEENGEAGQVSEGGVEGEANVEGVQPTPGADNSQQLDPIEVVSSLDLDPKVKEALIAGYLRNSDYTQKTQAIAGDRKLIDEYKAVKPFIDKVLNDPELYHRVFEENGQPGGQEAGLPDDPREFAEMVKQETIRAMKEEMANDAKANADYQAAEQLDPRLNSDPDFAQAIAGYVALDQEYVSGRKSAVQATQEALIKYNAFSEKQRKAFREEMNKKVSDRRMVVPQGGSPVGTNNGSIPTTMQEAAKLAEEELASS